MAGPMSGTMMRHPKRGHVRRGDLLTDQAEDDKNRWNSGGLEPSNGEQILPSRSLDGAPASEGHQGMLRLVADMTQMHKRHQAKKPSKVSTEHLSRDCFMLGAPTPPNQK